MYSAKPGFPRPSRQKQIPSSQSHVKSKFLAIIILCLTLALFSDSSRADDLSTGPLPRNGLALPSAQQLIWHDYEVGMFIHFGPSTFLDWVIDWPVPEYRAKEVKSHQMPDKPEHMFDPRNFNPKKLDTDQWVAAAEAMGAGYIVLVAKHHGGFCLWQTETSEHGVRNSPWRGGKGDVVADLAESCRKRGMPMGVYLSPQDHVHGAAGGGRCRTPEDQKRYQEIYRRQLTELLTRYGKMSEIWFDGGLAVEVGDLIRQHAPDAVVFQGPQANIRWVGNEDGFAPYPCWNAISTKIARSGIGTAVHGKPDGTVWMPVECDTKIRGQWHWASDKTEWGSASLKSLDVLMDTYYRSVGHGQVLLLNHSPDRSGRITDADFKRGAELGAEVRRRFGRSLAETDGRGTSIELDMGKATTVDHVITMEDIAHGERIRSYVLEGYRKGSWKQLCEGTAIGHKKIDRFPQISVEKIRLRVITASASPVVRKLAAYHVKAAAAATGIGLPLDTIELQLAAATGEEEKFDLSPWIKGPGQYTLILRAKGDAPHPLLVDLKLIIDGAEATQYLEPLEDKPGYFDLNITVTRSWPKGSLILQRSSPPKK